MATPNYIEERIPNKFKLGQDPDLWEIYELIGENSNVVFPQENDDFKQIRNSLRILKRYKLPDDDLKMIFRSWKIKHDLPLNLGLDFLK